MKYERYPQESLNNDFQRLIDVFCPDLSEYRNDIYPIYAGKVQQYSFEHRPFADLVREVDDALNCKDYKFLFMCETEDIVLESIKIIHSLIEKLSPKLKHENVIYLSGAANLENVYAEFCRMQGYTKKIKLISAEHFQAIAQRNAMRHLIETFEYQPKTKEKTFLCFNKLHREHRIMLLDKFFEHNLMEKAYYSFQGENADIGWKERLIDNRYPHIRNNINLIPLVLNINPNRRNPIDLIPDDFKYFDNSVFSIVTETVFFNNHATDPSIFFSEKIWKPIVMQHPFILVSRTGALAQLKKYGYQTFHPFIDETYDLITDDLERFNVLFAEILRLSKLNHEELLRIQQQIEPIVKFNHAHFLKNKHIKSISDFLT